MTACALSDEPKLHFPTISSFLPLHKSSQSCDTYHLKQYFFTHIFGISPCFIGFRFGIMDGSKTGRRGTSILCLPNSVIQRIIGIHLLSACLQNNHTYKAQSLALCHKRLARLLESVLPKDIRDEERLCTECESPECAKLQHLLTNYAHRQIKKISTLNFHPTCPQTSNVILQVVDKHCPNLRCLVLNEIPIPNHHSLSSQKEFVRLFWNLKNLRSLEQLKVFGGFGADIYFPLLKCLSSLSPRLSTIQLSYAYTSQLRILRKYFESRTHNLRSIWIYPCISHSYSPKPEIYEKLHNISVAYSSELYVNDDQANKELSKNLVTDIALHSLSCGSFIVAVHRVIIHPNQSRKMNFSVFQDSPYYQDHRCWHCEAINSEDVLSGFSHQDFLQPVIAYWCSYHTEDNLHAMPQKAGIKHLSLRSHSVRTQNCNLVFQVFNPVDNMSKMYPHAFLPSVPTHGTASDLITFYRNLDEKLSRQLFRNITSISLQTCADLHMFVMDMPLLYEAIGHNSIILTIPQYGSRALDEEIFYIQDALRMFQKITVLRVPMAVLSALHNLGNLNMLISRQTDLRLIHINSHNESFGPIYRYIDALSYLLSVLGVCAKLREIQWHVEFCIDFVYFPPTDPWVHVYNRIKVFREKVMDFVQKNPLINCISLQQTTDRLFKFSQFRLTNGCRRYVDDTERAQTG